VGFDVILPMVTVRLTLLVAGWLSQIVLPNPKYPVAEAVERGWHFSQSRLLDMWARWDAGWYFALIRGGYFVPEDDLRASQSSIAFFPLYPYAVKALVALLPMSMRTSERVLIIGLLVSNIFPTSSFSLLSSRSRYWAGRPSLTDSSHWRSSPCK
jgi:Gpi18-like mannosyltransferase